MPDKKNLILEILEETKNNPERLKNILEAFSFENSLNISLEDQKLFDSFVKDLKSEKFDDKNFQKLVDKIK